MACEQMCMCMYECVTDILLSFSFIWVVLRGAFCFIFFKICYKSYRKSSLYDRALDCLFQRVSLIGTRQWFIGSASIWCLPQQPAIGIDIRAETKWTWQSSTTLRSHIEKSHSIGIYSYECPYHEIKWVHVLWVPACLPPVSTVWGVAYLLFTKYIDMSHKSI